MKTINENITTLADRLDERYGKVGTATRINFEAKAIAIAVSKSMKESSKKQ